MKHTNSGWAGASLTLALCVQPGNPGAQPHQPGVSPTGVTAPLDLLGGRQVVLGPIYTPAPQRALGVRRQLGGVHTL